MSDNRKLFELTKIGDKIRIKPNKDLWNSKGKIFTVVKKKFDVNPYENYVLVFDKPFGQPSNIHYSINVCYVENVSRNRKYKLNRILNGKWIDKFVENED